MRTVSGIILMAASMALAQAPSPAWEEFTIGPPTANRTRFGPDGMRAEGVPLRRVLARAYGLAEHRIIAPSWIDDERYAITALVANPQDFEPLMQQELATRFHMLAHRELKDVPVYEIHTLNGVAAPPAQAGGGSGKSSGPAIKLNQSTVKTFAGILADVVQRPVFDETHLDGRFDFVLSWDRNAASLPAAVRNQLGLDLLESRRAVDLVIIDHIEKPQLAN